MNIGSVLPAFTVFRELKSLRLDRDGLDVSAVVQPKQPVLLERTLEGQLLPHFVAIEQPNDFRAVDVVDLTNRLNKHAIFLKTKR